MSDFFRLASILSDVYGVGPLNAPTYAVAWAVDRLAAEHGQEAAAFELSALNDRRDRMGYPLAYVGF